MWMFKGFLQELLEDVAVARLRPTPTTQVFILQLVDISEQPPFIPDVFLKESHRPFTAAYSRNAIWVFPL